MELQLEAVREKRLKDGSHLGSAGPAGHVGLHHQVKLIRFDPVRTGCYLKLVHAVSKHHQLDERRIDGDKPSTLNLHNLSLVGPARLDGSYFIGRIRVRCHLWHTLAT